MKQIKITYVATKTILMEVDENGRDKDGAVIYPQPVDPRGLTEVIQKIEVDNAPDLMCYWVAEGKANISVHVEEIH